jgi:hypothetical protein
VNFIFSLTFVLLLALKLGVGDTGVVDWSWWAVTAPLWIGAIWVSFWAIVLAIVGD